MAKEMMNREVFQSAIILYPTKIKLQPPYPNSESISLSLATWTD